MLDTAQQPTAETVVGPRTVDTRLGTSRGDLSKQWFARPHDQRFVNLSDLRDFRKKRFEESTELRIDNKKLELLATDDPQTKEDLHKLTVGLPNGNVVAPTNWAFGQIGGLAKAPVSYLKTLPAQIVRDALNYGLRFTRDVELIKVFSDDDELMAATGPDYGRIPDHEVVEAVMQVAGDGIGDSLWKVPGVLNWQTMIYDPMIGQPVTLDRTTIFGSDRDIFIFLVDDTHPIEVGKLPDGSPDYVFRGFYIKNSQVGRTSCVIAAFYLRAICCNRMMWGVEGFEEINIRHTKYAPDRFIEAARPALEALSNGSDTKIIAAVQKAKAAKLVDTDGEAIEFLKKRGFSGKRATDVMEWVKKNEDRDARTAWDFAQGITGVAKDIPFQDQRVEVELAAGAILDTVT